jgi:hypothetical protein
MGMLGPYVQILAQSKKKLPVDKLCSYFCGSVSNEEKSFKRCRQVRTEAEGASSEWTGSAKATNIHFRFCTTIIVSTSVVAVPLNLNWSFKVSLKNVVSWVWFDLDENRRRRYDDDDATTTANVFLILIYLCYDSWPSVILPKSNRTKK